MNDAGADGWTVDEAVTELDPPMDVGEVRALIVAFRVHQVGHRRGGRGRPAPAYDQTELLQAHAAAIAVRSGLVEMVLGPGAARSPRLDDQ